MNNLELWVVEQIAEYFEGEFDQDITDAKQDILNDIANNNLIGLANSTNNNDNEVQASYDFKNEQIVIEYYDDNKEEFIEKRLDVKYQDINNYLDFGYLIFELGDNEND